MNHLLVDHLWHYYSQDGASLMNDRLLIKRSRAGKKVSQFLNNSNNFIAFIYLFINVMFKRKSFIKIYPQVLFYKYLLSPGVIKKQGWIMYFVSLTWQKTTAWACFEGSGLNDIFHWLGYRPKLSRSLFSFTEVVTGLLNCYLQRI